MFHTSMGMTKDIVVSNMIRVMNEPMADIDINISSTDGIVFNDSISRVNISFRYTIKIKLYMKILLDTILILLS